MPNSLLLLCLRTCCSLDAAHFSLPSLPDSLPPSSKLKVSITVSDSPGWDWVHFMCPLEILCHGHLPYHIYCNYLLTFVPSFQSPQAEEAASQSAALEKNPAPILYLRDVSMTNLNSVPLLVCTRNSTLP